MSLARQSQQWFPTSVQVTVHQARSLRIKGKNGTNDAYAIIQVAKDKFSTSVAEKCVAPVWKEEASFDLPLFHPGNAERCTLYIIVMHRAQVGLDKFLGQAVINLLDLHDNSARKKTDWFKLVDKTGKEDKVRGEVLLDIQFIRNNMSASMFDLSMQDKPRSAISKLKAKVRGKKKDGFSDSASAIVPSVNQTLTDSEGEADAQSLNQSPEGKKKSKLKNLFGPKSNLQRNISQSMSTLGTFPEKNSSLSASRSSGLNVDSPEVKKKFKFLAHKRTASTDSKVSQGPFSLLGRSKQSNNDANNLCINGSHVYTEEAEPKSGSTLSLNSSGQGSVEDVHKHPSDVSADSTTSTPIPSIRFESADRTALEQQRHQEEEERRQAEERRKAEAKRLEDEEKRRAEAKRLQEEERRYQEEQERKRRFLEDEAKKKKQREEEDRIKQEEERRMLEAAETQRLEEERRRVEEQKQQDSMTERLTSLFGMIKKKEEKKDEVQHPEEEVPKPVPRSRSKEPISNHSTNPVEDISLISDSPTSSNESSADHQKSSHDTQIPSAVVFLNRTAKVSAVKPRLTQSLDCEIADCQSPSQLCPSPANSTLSSIPSESPDNFLSLHTSLAPQISGSLVQSSRGSTENLSSVGSSPTMADQKRKALLPPKHSGHGNLTLTLNQPEKVPVRQIQNPAYEEADGVQQDKKAALPLPDYETLYPQKRHGVQGITRWDHVIAEVNQKHRDVPTQFVEMSVDGPEEQGPTPTSVPQESPSIKPYRTHLQETKPISTKSVVAPAPPKPVISSRPQSVADSNKNQSQSIALLRPNPSSLPGHGHTDSSSRQNLSGMSRDEVKNVLLPSPSAPRKLRPTSRIETTLADDEGKAHVTMTKEAPTAKPRQRASGKESAQEEEPAAMLKNSINSNIQSLSSSSVSKEEKKREPTDNFADFNPFPSSELLSKDPWTQPNHNQEVDDIFTGKSKDHKPAKQGMTDDFDTFFSQQKPTDPFAVFNGSDSNKDSGNSKKDDGSKQASPVVESRNLQGTKKTLPLAAHLNNGVSKPQEPANEKGVTVTTTTPDHHTREVMNESLTQQPQADVKAQGKFSDVDLFGAEPFTVPSDLPSSQPLQIAVEEPASQTGGLSGGKKLLRAWVSPSETPPVSAQNSIGGGLALTPRRPHPVKPLGSQHPISAPAVKEIKFQDNTPLKIKVADSVGSGPYTQLTQEELITLVVKQQSDLTKKDAKIVELEEYIDNLLVRVIDEQPSILQALNSAKPF